MKALDTLFREVEAEARRRLGPGFTIAVRLELDQSAETIAGAWSARPDQPLLNVRQVAAMLEKSPATIRAWCKDGALPARKIGRSWVVSRSALERLGETVDRT